MGLKYVYCFCFYSNASASVRYRAQYVMEELAAEYDIKYNIVYPGYSLKNILHFLKIWSSALLFRKKDSLILFQKIQSNGVYANALKFLLFWRKSNTFYDIDDADHLRYPSETIHHFMKKCAKCLVGSRALYNHAAQFNKNVVLLTSPVLSHGITVKRNSTFTIGWVGEYSTDDPQDVFSHANGLNTFLFPALKELDFSCKVVLMGVLDETDRLNIKKEFAAHPNITFEMPSGIDWLNEKKVYEMISSFDIGVSPLIDHPFNQAKSAFKVKQYLSCGVPALASPIGENYTFVKNGVNGYLCTTKEDFRKYITLIKGLPNKEYENLSKNALDSRPEFSFENYCEKLIREHQD